ncbi:MAG: aminotransferase class V-fold PLP-dependent enzyme [Planctomycetota bacterium]
MPNPALRSSTPAASVDRAPSPILDSFEGRVHEPARHGLDPRITMLNGASYGCVPDVVRDAQHELARRIELDPVRFYKHDLERYCDHARQALAGLLNCDAGDLALMPNGTFAVSSVLLSLRLQPGDEIVVTDHEYQATLNELNRVCAVSGARIVIAKIPFPEVTPEIASDAVIGAIGARTRLVVCSHITSATSLLMPVAHIVRRAAERGVDVLIDGAHGPGQVPIDLHALRPAYYAASCHKWLGASKGTGFLYADPDRQKQLKPAVLSCRTHAVRPERKAFLCDFDYVGTEDRTGNLVLPVAIEHLSAQHPGGLAGLQQRNRDIALTGARHVAEAARVKRLAPASMTASMVTIPLPFPESGVTPGAMYDDALWDRLRLDHSIQAPAWGLPGVHPRLMRVSCQWYNTPADFERLADVLPDLLASDPG